MTGIILSFYGYDDDVRNMMQLVSHGTRKYLRIHWEQVAGFLVHWPLPTTGVIEFGDSKWNWDPEYPSLAQMKDLPKYRRVKWSGFRFKQNNNMSQLCGLGLVFNDGSQTPMFETETAIFQR